MSKVIIRLEHASVRFNWPCRSSGGIKEHVMGLLRKELLFQEFFALRDIDLTVREGESWGFVGRNGSGKSTLLKLITGILRPMRGRCR
jgi:lipopolysaccharide transport system ATP-binding protein